MTARGGCDAGCARLRQFNISQRAPGMLQVDTQEQQGSDLFGIGNASRISEVGLERNTTRLQQDTVEKTPSWEEVEEQKKTTKPLPGAEETKEKVTVKPPPEVEGIKNTTVETAPKVEGNKEKTVVRQTPGVKEGVNEKTTPKSLPMVEGAKEKATVKPSSGVRVARNDNTTKDKTKPKEPPLSVKTVRPVTQAAAVTEKRLRAADFKSEPQWGFEDEYLLDSSPPPLVSAYGYITEGHEKYSDQYYDKEWKRLVFYINHDFNLEKQVWKKLHDENIIKLYQRS